MTFVFSVSLILLILLDSIKSMLCHEVHKYSDLLFKRNNIFISTITIATTIPQTSKCQSDCLFPCSNNYGRKLIKTNTNQWLLNRNLVFRVLYSFKIQSTANVLYPYNCWTADEPTICDHITWTQLVLSRTYWTFFSFFL